VAVSSSEFQVIKQLASQQLICDGAAKGPRSPYYIQTVLLQQ